MKQKKHGQTFSVASLASYIGIEHNYKTLLVSTNFKDTSLENCFYDPTKTNQIVEKLTQGERKGGEVGIESGVEGLVKIINSNKTSPEIVTSYTKIILKNRLDVLPGPRTQIYAEYENIIEYYPDILKTANRCYDLVLVDIYKRMDENQAKRILELADVVVVNMTQRLQTIEKMIELRQNDEFYKQNKIMLSIGRYDSFSKYTAKNIVRAMKEKKAISVTPYNTLLFEACSEGRIVDFFLQIRNIQDQTDRNVEFREQVKKNAENIFAKLQELQMRY